MITEYKGARIKFVYDDDKQNKLKEKKISSPCAGYSPI